MQGSGTRPLGVGEVIDVAMKVYAHNARLLFRIAATVYLPALVIFVFAIAAAAARSPLGGGERVLRITSVSLLALALVVGSLWAAAGCTKALSELYLGRAPLPASVLLETLRRLPVLIAAAVLVAIGVILGLIAFIVPGIWLIGCWLLITPAIVIEGVGPLAALNRSRHLVSGRWWPVVGATLVGGIAVGVANNVISAIVRAPFEHDNHISLAALLVVYLVGTVVVGVLLQPFSIAVSTVLYYDLRLRKEGFDPWLEYRGPTEFAPPAAFQHRPPLGTSGVGPERTFGPEDVGTPGGPPFWPPPPGWRPGS